MAERTDRILVAASRDRAYFTPALLEENSESGKINFGNVFAGLQQYQAINNSFSDELPSGQKIGHLLEIFKNPNDLSSLAKVVELQTGVDGLIKAVLDSYLWSQWQIYPKIEDPTEIVSLVPHVDVCLKVGEEPLMAVSIRNIEWKDEEKKFISNLSDFNIFRAQDEVTTDDEGNGVLPDMNLRFVEVLPGRMIAFDVDDVQIDGDFSFDKPVRPFERYILAESGRLKFDVQERFDRKCALQHLLKDANGSPVSPLPNLVNSDQKELVAILSNDNMAKRALVWFLLPYCDMPTTSGAHYVLPDKGSY